MYLSSKDFKNYCLKFPLVLTTVMKINLLRILSLLVFLIIMPSAASALVVSYMKDRDGVTFTLDKGLMKIKICDGDIVEVKYTSLHDFEIRNSLIINNAWKDLPGFKVSEKQGTVVITTSRVKIIVSKLTNAITYADLDDHLILAEDEQDAKLVKPATVAGINTYTCSTTFKSPADEALFGLGCHPEDTLSINYKGRNQDLIIRYMTGAMPVLVSNKGYGLMWDNYSPSNFYGGEAGNTKFKYESESGTMIDYYFFYGPELDHVIASYRLATGAAPMFPKWSLGLFQSQDRYKSQHELLAVKDKYRNNNIPLDCIVQDWFYWEPDVIGSHHLWPARYPDPKSMVDELHKANIHAMISIWPVFAARTRNYEAMKKAGNLTSLVWDNVMTKTPDNYYDAHSENARAMYWQQAKDSLIAKHGWDAWWVDQCEPDNGNENLDLRRQCTFPIGRGIDYFNTYSLTHTTGLYNHWRADIAGKRAFFLVRQAFAGQQRNATTLWSSDITCSWRAFQSQVPQGINACASGIPYWTSDIGGYRDFNWTAPNWTLPSNKELFTRWFQFGTFSPIFRIHGKGERALFSDNWDDKMKAILLNYDNLRYRLLPYIYSMTWKVTNEGYTLMRSLAFDFMNDANINSIPDQYMFGTAFLVSPVTERMISLERGAPTKPSRKVYLPKSALWYDFWTGEKFPGGQTIDAPAPIETIPLFIRAGSIVPMGPFLQYATEKAADPLEIRIYPGANGTFTLYEDENDNYNYEKGSLATIAFQWNDATRTFSVGKRQGSYPGMINERTFNIIVVGTSQTTGVGLTELPDKVLRYNGQAVTIKL
jgi:alpha-D-xyloside xylohydrolase